MNSVEENFSSNKNTFEHNIDSKTLKEDYSAYFVHSFACETGIRTLNLGQ